MFILDYSKLKYFLFIFLFVIISGLSKSQETEYLNTVIERINSLETELKNIQENKSSNNVSNNDSYTNAIASHEQRLLNLEEELGHVSKACDISQLAMKMSFMCFPHDHLV